MTSKGLGWRFFAITLVACAPAASVAGQSGAPRTIVAVAPEYPDIALQAQIEGIVTVRAEVGSTGVVTGTSVIAGHQLLAKSALAAAKLWRFDATSDASQVEIAFGYQLLPPDACWQKQLPRFSPPSRVDVAKRKIVVQCMDCGPELPIQHEICD